MSLADWEQAGWLTPHRTSPQEISELLAIVQRDLHDSKARDVSADWRFTIAFNAVLQAAKAAALRAEQNGGLVFWSGGRR